MPRDSGWMPLIGLLFPLFLVLGIVAATPGDALQIFGIRGSVWLLFACAPITTLCLWACRLFSHSAAPDPAVGEGLDR